MSSISSIPPFIGATVQVSILHGGKTTVPTAYVVKSQIPGHDVLEIPCYSFLVENKNQGKRILYDLGIMKAWKEKLPPSVLGQIEFAKAVIDVEKDVVDQLQAAGVPLDWIDAIVWSHHHMDHTGDPSLFPPSTSLVVGPGFKNNKTTFPGYPQNPDAVVTHDGSYGREVIELDFSTAPEIHGFPAIDYFNDGSLYILKSHGHTHDHLSALARTSENKFILLGGDVAHHPAEFRPTPDLPLPPYIDSSLLGRHGFASPCPATIFENVHPRRDTGIDYRTTPFYELNELMNASLPDANASVKNLQALDKSPDVLVIIAHDASLLNVLPLFPNTLNDWYLTGYKDRGMWGFLKDFVVEAAQ